MKAEQDNCQSPNNADAIVGKHTNSPLGKGQHIF